MKLYNRSNTFKDEYKCALTEKLDLLAKLTESHYYKHYILADDFCKKEKCLAIRVPGGTVGGIHINDNNVITDIIIDTQYVVKTYPDNVNETVKEFIGQTIEF